MKLTLRKLIDDRGLKYVFVAKKIGRSKASVSSYMSGYRIPKIDTMQKLADVLNVDIKVVLDCFYEKPQEVEV